MDKLESLYWEGIRRELENIIDTLRQWQESDLSGVSLEEEIDNCIHGFDTFLDQVNGDSREFAALYSQYFRYPHVRS